MTDKKNAKKYFISGAIVFALFAILTLLIKTVDVKAVGPNGSEIGLSGINTYFRDLIGVNMTLYDMTELLGYLAIATAGVFALIGLCQMISRKSLLKVDKKLISLAGLYAAMAFFYVLFEIVVINYRPVIEAGAEHVEASFPSSHTMLVCVIMGGAFVILKNYVKQKGLRLALQSLAFAVAVVTAVGRLLSGVHWFTDILGGVFISLALVTLYAAVCDAFEGKKE